MHPFEYTFQILKLGQAHARITRPQQTSGTRGRAPEWCAAALGVVVIHVSVRSARSNRRANLGPVCARSLQRFHVSAVYCGRCAGIVQ